MFRLFIIFLFFLPHTATADLKTGTVAIYSDGRVEKLLSTDDTGRLWEDQRKRLYKKSHLPFIPILSYQKFPDRHQGYRQRVIFGKPETLKPFGTEDSVSFELIKKSDASTGKKYWQCRYLGEGRYKLDSKRYKTHNYSCVRSVLFKETVYKTKETIELRYSPTLQLIVDRKRVSSNGKKKRVTLIQVLKPKKATAKRIARTLYKLRNDK